MSTVVHIGFPKCASTTLQRSVFPLASRFEKRPVEDLANSRGLVSNESILTRITPSDLARAVPDARVLIVFREPVAYYESAYAQFLRGLGNKPNRDASPEEWLLPRLDHYSSAVAHAEAFPSVVIPLERLSARTADLAALIGVSESDVCEALSAPPKNTRLTTGGLLRRKLRTVSPMAERIAGSATLAPLRRLVRGIDKPLSESFSPALRDLIERETRADYENMLRLC